MRVLHTGDWHVGRTIRGRSRREEHEAVLAEIVGIADEQEVDLVLVAGDIFDTAAPTPESEQIVYGALLELARADRQVVVLAGNHDNPSRLEALAKVFEPSGVHLRPFFAPATSGGLIELEIAGTRCQVVAVPWLSKRHVIRADDLMKDTHDAGDHQASYADRMVYLLEGLTAAFDADAVTIIVAHLTVVGGALGGGEREAHTVLEYAVSANAFPGTASYVALGHLHRTQRIDHPAPVWYSGSPLQLDFGEARDEKAVLIFDAEPGLPVGRVEPVPLAAGRRLRTITGSMDDLRAIEGTTGDDYLRVVLTETARAGLAEQVRDLFPHAVEVRVESEREPTTTARPERLGRSSPELFGEYLVEADAADERVLSLFTELHEQASTSREGAGDAS